MRFSPPTGRPLAAAPTVRAFSKACAGYAAAGAVIVLSGVAAVLAVGGFLAFLLAVTVAHAAASAVEWLLNTAAQLFERARKRPSEDKLPKAGKD